MLCNKNNKVVFIEIDEGKRTKEEASALPVGACTTGVLTGKYKHNIFSNKMSFLNK